MILIALTSPDIATCAQSSERLGLPTYRNLRTRSLVPTIVLQLFCINMEIPYHKINTCKHVYTPEHVCTIDKRHHTLVAHDG